MNILGVDLNQIRALDALLAERNVTRAARRLGITQAAASNALTRLRVHFEDPLLVRAGRSMTLTPRAEALVEPAAGLMRAAERLLSPAERFEPASLRATFRIATSDHIDLVLLRDVEASLSAEAPGVDLHVTSFGLDAFDALRDGSVDLAIAPIRERPPDIEVELLFEDRLVLVMREGHPATTAMSSIEAFAGLRHLLVSPRGIARGPVDDALAARGLSRRVARMVPQFGAALLLVARSDLVTVVPEMLADMLGADLRLSHVAVPVPLPRIEIQQIWHRRTAVEARHAYLRSLVRRSSLSCGGGIRRRGQGGPGRGTIPRP